MNVLLGLYKRAFLFKVGNNSFSCLVSVHSGVSGVVGCYFRVVCKHVYYRQVVSQSYLKVVRVVRRSDFNHAGSEIHFNVFVRHNRYLTVNNRQNKSFAHKVSVSFIVRVYRNGGISEQCFGSCGCKLKITAAVRERIAQVPEMTCLLLVFNLSVRN